MKQIFQPTYVTKHKYFTQFEFKKKKKNISPIYNNIVKCLIKKLTLNHFRSTNILSLQN